MRDHSPITIDEFNGLWARGDKETCPLDHSTDVQNVLYPFGAIATRDGVDIFPIGPNGDDLLGEVARIYTYVRYDNEQRILALDTLGNIYDCGAVNPLNPVLSIPEMTDFAFANVAGRAYISPHDGVHGLEDEFLYVYLGDGNAARKAGGKGPVGNNGFAAASSATLGNVEPGVHIFAVVYETDSGFLTRLGPIEDNAEYNDPETKIVDFFAEAQVFLSDKTISLTNVPISPDSFVKKRHIVATKAIPLSIYTGNRQGYEFFFVPEGNIEDNTTTTKDVNFYDADLLESASYLFDLLSEIPAFANLGIYHNRLVGVTEFGQPNADPLLDESSLESTARVSFPGEPEAFSMVDGLIIAPLEGNPLTNVQEFRDVLYLFKKTRTYAYSDNGDVPSSWPLTVVDQGIGASIHGIATVLDSGGVNIEYIIIIDFSGVMLFNGVYQRPELSWKIEDFWFTLDHDEFKEIQCINDSLQQIVYITLPDGRLLFGDYSNGLTSKDIKWGLWKFDFEATTVTLFDTSTLVIGSKAPLVEIG